MSQDTGERDEENVLRRLRDIQTTLEKVLGDDGQKVTDELGRKIPKIRKIVETTFEKVLGEEVQKVTEERIIPEMRKTFETTFEKVLGEEVQKVTEERIIPEIWKIFETTLEKVLGEEVQKVTEERIIPEMRKMFETTFEKVLGEEVPKVTEERIIPDMRKIFEEKDRRIRELEMGKATVESQSQPTDDPNKTKEQSGEKEPAKPETRNPKLSSDDAGESMETEIDLPEEGTPTAKSSSPSTDDPNGTKEQSSENNPSFFSKIKKKIIGAKKETSCSSSPKPKKSVQINDPTNTKSSMKFASTLTENLKNDFNCLMNNTGLGLVNNIPLIVICIRSSRLKADVELALSKVSYSAKCVVLIVHTGAESNLPVVPSSQKLGGNWTNVEFIDMGFDVDYGGIYDCCHNKEGLERLSEYINAFPCL